ncbi:hydrolase Nlp/P60 [Eggerthella sp. BIOML-A4]|uniref:NlpC/P60 family protein n=1 Tax=Eggerthella sp. BIOML-A4 TaxID=2584641 RepID=UPI0012B1233E|nr:NlpC/P60 family protein [Eggerthella sp. BIOML-A4]MSA62502.1 hydrolase Nlp/P60 [Gordonibacter pamelaeae]MZK27818.1 hydrolase Nlp/P60 [Eggerthella sp. BIOML-A4]
MDPRELDKDHCSIADIVTADKVDAVSSGIVKDGESQSLSALAGREDALGMRNPKKGAKGTTRKAKATAFASASSKAGTEPASAQAPSEEAAHAADETNGRLKVRRVLERQAVSELDDTDEFEGAQGAYDAGKGAKRGIMAARERKAKGAARASNGGKGAGAAKGKSAGAAGAGKASPSAAIPGHARAAQASAQAAGGAAKTAASASGSTAIAGAVGGSGIATAGGVLAGIIAFVLVALLVGQIVSALFGFWDAEDKKRSMEGLPPYITYEMVEEAVRCQEEFGHPAGCTIAQIICESGQGETMSQLATRDHNLFGMKWASSFASAPEVAGKAGWTTHEEYTPGQMSTITAYFTVFKGDVECIRFRSRVFLQASHYKNNALIRQAIAEHSSDKMAEGLKDAGWATSSSYVESLKAALDAYNLRRFDSMRADDLESGELSADAIIAAAYSQLGVPYVWGGTTPGVGLDCSGLTQYCYRQAGIVIPRNSEDQAAFGRKVPVSEATPGDILWRPGHVGIYIGEDRYIHEPHTGAVCTIASGTSYFTSAIKIR